jgi:hypothetical protein
VKRGVDGWSAGDHRLPSHLAAAGKRWKRTVNDKAPAEGPGLLVLLSSSADEISRASTLLAWLLVGPLAEPNAGPASVLIDELGADCFQCSSDCQVGPASLSIAVLPSQIAAARRTFAVRTLLRPTLKKQRKNSGGDNSGKIFTA